MKKDSEDVFRKLAEHVAAAGGVRAYARANGISPQYVSDMMHRKRGLGPRTLETLGYEKIVTSTVKYRPAGNPGGRKKYGAQHGRPDPSNRRCL